MQESGTKYVLQGGVLIAVFCCVIGGGFIALSQVLSANTKTIQDQKEHIADIRARNAELETQLKTIMAQLAELRALSETQKNRIDQLETQKTNSDGQRAELERQNAAYRANIAELKDKNTDLVSKITKLEKDAREGSSQSIEEERPLIYAGAAISFAIVMTIAAARLILERRRSILAQQMAELRSEHDRLLAELAYEADKYENQRLRFHDALRHEHAKLEEMRLLVKTLQREAASQPSVFLPVAGLKSGNGHSKTESVGLQR